MNIKTSQLKEIIKNALLETINSDESVDEGFLDTVRQSLRQHVVEPFKSEFKHVFNPQAQQTSNIQSTDAPAVGNHPEGPPSLNDVNKNLLPYGVQLQSMEQLNVFNQLMNSPREYLDKMYPTDEKFIIAIKKIINDYPVKQQSVSQTQISPVIGNQQPQTQPSAPKKVRQGFSITPTKAALSQSQRMQAAGPKLKMMPKGRTVYKPPVSKSIQQPARGGKRYPKLVRGKQGTYKLEETITEEQLKTLIKAVIEEARSQQDEGNLKSLAAAGLIGLAGYAGLQHPVGQDVSSKVKQAWTAATTPRHIDIPNPNEELPSEKNMDSWDLAQKYSDRNTNVANQLKPLVNKVLKEAPKV